MKTKTILIATALAALGLIGRRVQEKISEPGIAPNTNGTSGSNYASNKPITTQIPEVRMDSVLL